MATTVQSRKSKGRLLQKYVVKKFLDAFPFLTTDDVSSRSMGAGGEDVLLSQQARKVLPLSIECKNTEKINIWQAYEQAKENAGDWVPVVVHKKNRKDPIVIVDLDYFISLHTDCHALGVMLHHATKTPQK